MAIFCWRGVPSRTPLTLSDHATYLFAKIKKQKRTVDILSGSLLSLARCQRGSSSIDLVDADGFIERGSPCCLGCGNQVIK